MTKSTCGVPDILAVTAIDFSALCPWDEKRIAYAFDIETKDISKKWGTRYDLPSSREKKLLQ
ncbi:hypothetical protein [Bacillus thuringiensis]|uniref:hypothetical protein n=2 Tax=Bacillus thuringiensis TaxID=1428 RepID=UPI001145B6C3|nr:hypothetical protein [Bacillus thuringiensis]